MTTLANAIRFALPTSCALALAAISCAPILGLERATCDESTDVSCVATETGIFPEGVAGGGELPGLAGSGGSGMGNQAGSTMNLGGGGMGMTMAGGGGLSMSGGAGGLGFEGEGGAGEMPTGQDEVDPAVQQQACADYCSGMGQYCSAGSGFQQFEREAICLAFCDLLELGDLDAPEPGNTLACRMEQLRLAEQVGEVELYCPNAGPGGGTLCGSDCEGYCTMMVPQCGQRFSALFDRYIPYETQEGCLAECEGLPVAAGAFTAPFENGDTVQCRLYHVSAAMGDPTSHCEHAVGQDLCIPPEDNALEQ